MHTCVHVHVYMCACIHAYVRTSTIARSSLVCAHLQACLPMHRAQDGAKMGTGASSMARHTHTHGRARARTHAHTHARMARLGLSVRSCTPVFASRSSVRPVQHAKMVASSRPTVVRLCAQACICVGEPVSAWVRMSVHAYMPGCHCDGLWTGADCGTCAQTCENGGLMRQDSCSCSCVPGYSAIHTLQTQTTPPADCTVPMLQRPSDEAGPSH